MLEIGQHAGGGGIAPGEERDQGRPSRLPDSRPGGGGGGWGGFSADGLRSKVTGLQAGKDAGC